ncbi:MAG TPA: PH domain-containing protein [Candidatus Saccharimonadales bacterium]|nr:PH domain-containing protein [Candidatus Saccharimonadales bacterium]
MVSLKSVEAQLKRLNFNYHAWGKTEIRELPRILMPDEELYECVNGFYEGGFAMLVSTDMRVLLIDKKPLNYLTVEDLRFDMINEIDYSHRLLGAHIKISTGSKTLKFTSYNQPRLRKLIQHVQDRMAELKRQQDQHAEGQKQHLEQLNQQLQAYLIAQQTYQLQLQQKVDQAQAAQPPRPSPELADFLFTQNLMQEFNGQKAKPAETSAIEPNPMSSPEAAVFQPVATETTEGTSAQELYNEAVKEIFGSQPKQELASSYVPNPTFTSNLQTDGVQDTQGEQKPLRVPDLNSLRIAYSKLPMALRNRKFGRPSFHAHSHAALIQKP